MRRGDSKEGSKSENKSESKNESKSERKSKCKSESRVERMQRTQRCRDEETAKERMRSPKTASSYGM